MNSVVPNLDNIFTATELHSDPFYDPYTNMNFWDRHWREIIWYTLFAVAFITSIVLMCIPATAGFGYGMFMAGMQAAITGAVTGGVVGGIVSAVQDNGFWDGASQGIINGFIDGFTTGALLFCASQAIGAIVKAANTETFYRTISNADYEYLQLTGKIKASANETMVAQKVKYLKHAKKYDGVTVKFKVTKGTRAQLEAIGVRNGATKIAKLYPNMPKVTSGWKATNAFFKFEQGYINIGLGEGTALEIFNNNIISFGII